MRITYTPATRTYAFEGVSETELGIFDRLMFESAKIFRAGSDLAMYSERMTKQINAETENLVDRETR